MPSFEPRRRFLTRAGGVLGCGVSLAGCLGGTPSAGDELSNTSAKQRALDAEREYLESRLGNASCLSEWGITATTTSKEAAITNRTAEGVLVEIRHPYSYEAKHGDSYSIADQSSQATYLVTNEGAERVSGDDVSPC
ncbi:hypothetical protein ACFQJC_01750 [Haloferax namakaokahaiae]|uniref:Secreted protein n=1 Tax=Haloferax namakaokahaiae TaxID=1748331 RepID=A0ABD5ZAA9_9EURY